MIDSKRAWRGSGRRWAETPRHRGEIRKVSRAPAVKVTDAATRDISEDHVISTHLEYIRWIFRCGA